MALNRIQKIALISPNPRFLDYSPNSRFPNFNGRFIMPDSVLPLIGTIVKNAGYDVEVFMEGIAPIPWKRVLEADLVGFSAVTCNINRAMEMAAKVKANKDVPTILGGPHGSMVPEHAVQHFDYVVREEGEETIIELLDALNNGSDLTSIKGISYLRDGGAHHNPSRELTSNFDTIPDPSLIYGYRFNPLKVLLQAKAHVHFLETSRGCPYPCNFCWRIGGKKMRHRSVESVIRNIKQNTKFFKGFPNLIIILDSYFGANREKTKEVLREMIKSGVKARYFLFARCEIADDIEMLRLMKKAGVIWIFMGVESISNDTLDHFDKRQTIEKVRKSIDRIRRHGMHVCASFVLGSDDDTKDTWRGNIQFAQESGATWVMLNILTDFHNGQGEELMPSYRVFQKNWDYYTTHFVTHYPKYMRPSELEQNAIDGYRLFFSWRNILTNLFKGRIGAAFFQLPRRIVMKPHLCEMEAYIPQLKQIEKDMYDVSGHLIEEKLLPTKRLEESAHFDRPIQQDHTMIFPMAYS